MDNEEKRTKAEFRYIRERVGISQTLMAELVGCTPRSVRYWEDPVSLSYPPQEAWDALDKALVYQDAIVEFTLSKVEEAAEIKGSLPKYVDLPYWLSKAQYEAVHADDNPGTDSDWSMANANARVVAIRLEMMGVEVRWANYDPMSPDNKTPSS